MGTHSAMIYTVDPAAAEAVQQFCRSCGLEPGEPVCPGDRITVPYANACNAAVAVVYGPTEIPSEKYCLPVLQLRLTPAEVEGQIRAAGFDPEQTAVLLPGALLWDPARLCRNQPLRWFLEEDYPSRQAALLAAAARAPVIAAPTTCQAAVEAGGRTFVPLLPGVQSLTASLARAQERLSELRRDWALQAWLTAYMNSAPVGFIEVDRQGKIVTISDRACTLLNYRGAFLEERYVLNVFPQLDRDLLSAALYHGASVNQATVGRGDNCFQVSIEPCLADTEPSGAVIALEKLHQAPRETAPSSAPEGFRARYRFSTFQYTSTEFSYMIRQAKMAANTDAPILIVGEEGTEVTQLAQCIHNESRRDRKGYMEIQCDAWSPEYIRSALFETAANPAAGTLRGVEVCNGGTVFFNHIDALSPDLQYMVYSLTTGWYSPMNDLRRLPVDLRIIASTDRNLRELVRVGDFREDLYYVLSAISLNIPPMRKRNGDKKGILGYFMERHCRAYNKVVSLTPGAMEFLCRYDWPGNVREMDNFSRKIVLAAPGKSAGESFVRALMEESALSAWQEPAAAETDPDQTLAPEARQIMEALRRNGGNRIKTAAELGISKTTLWRRMQKYGITAAWSL